MATYKVTPAGEGRFVINSLQVVIQHGKTKFSPPIKDGIELEWSRADSAGKLTFTIIKMPTATMSFDEGDEVTFYVNGNLKFVGYVFKKTRDRQHHIEVTCYDKLRYLKNKFSYSFVNKTATQIIQSICKDNGVPTGTLEDTKYIIPSLVEENAEGLDIILTALQETLANTGQLYNLFDNCGKIELKNSLNMHVDSVITPETAQNFDYTSSIDDETYNSVVLYYKPQSTTKQVVDESDKVSGTYGGSSQAESIISLANSQVGISESPKGSNRVKYTSEYGSINAWCCMFVWWVFKHAGLSNLFYGGRKIASCAIAADWFKSKGRWYTSPKRGDVVYYTNGSRICHTGIVVSVNSNGSFTTVEGNWGDKVSQCTIPASGNHNGQRVAGFGRPAYSS